MCKQFLGSPSDRRSSKHSLSGFWYSIVGQAHVQLWLDVDCCGWLQYQYYALIRLEIELVADAGRRRRDAAELYSCTYHGTTSCTTYSCTTRRLLKRNTLQLCTCTPVVTTGTAVLRSYDLRFRAVYSCICNLGAVWEALRK